MSSWRDAVASNGAMGGRPWQAGLFGELDARGAMV